MKSIYLALYLIIHADICFFSRTQLLFLRKHIFLKNLATVKRQFGFFTLSDVFNGRSLCEKWLHVFAWIICESSSSITWKGVTFILLTLNLIFRLPCGPLFSCSFHIIARWQQIKLASRKPQQYSEFTPTGSKPTRTSTLQGWRQG